MTVFAKASPADAMPVHGKHKRTRPMNHVGEWVLSQSRCALFIRICQPFPLDLKGSTMSARRAPKLTPIDSGFRIGEDEHGDREKKQSEADPFSWRLGR